MPENPVNIRTLTFDGGEFEGVWLNFSDVRAYMDQIRAEPKYAADVPVLDKFEEALVGALVNRVDAMADLGD
jgi:hypothetical protein